MKETGVLLNTYMVIAEREGRKTQTRRLDGLKKVNENPNEWEVFGTGISECGTNFQAIFHNLNPTENLLILKCPFGVVGDRLWVRETLEVDGYLDVWYAADQEPLEGPPELGGSYEKAGKIPSIFMPRWASRTTLEITDIRVERVSEITPADIEAEGLSGLPKYISAKVADVWKAKFEALWNSVYEKRGHGWDKNPFVWVITFKRVEVPV